MGDEKEIEEEIEEPIAKCHTIKIGNSSASIHLFGATLISWVANDWDMLFFSRRSLFCTEDIINGGVPMVFPHFGPWGDNPEHGFARVCTWKLVEETHNSISLILRDTALTRAYWNHKFLFQYNVVLIDDDNMKIDITITNLDDEPFRFVFLLHNYLAVKDVLSCCVNGLKGSRYIDKVPPPVLKNKKREDTCIEDREDVVITGYTDRVYLNTRVVHRIKNIAPGKDILLEKMNLPDTLLYNPWIEQARMLKNYKNDDWKIMLGVSSGDFSAVLEPKEQFVACQIMSVESSS